jgi:hypothetical protein
MNDTIGADGKNKTKNHSKEIQAEGEADISLLWFVISALGIISKQYLDQLGTDNSGSL